MAKNIEHIQHIKSSVVLENEGIKTPKLPNPSALTEGEIAVNYAKGYETLSIKNESGDVVTFSSDNYYTEKKLGSGFTGENSGVTVTEALENVEITVDQVIDSGTSASTNAVATKAVYDAITDNELVWAMAYTTLSGAVSSHTANTIIHVTQADKTAWNNKVDSTDIANFFDDAKYEDSGTSKVINFYHGNTIKATINADDFIIDGMVDDVRIETVAGSGTCLVIDFNTASGKQDINIPISDIFDASNYYTKQEIDNKLGTGFSVSSVTEVIESNERVTATALNSLNTKVGSGFSSSSITEVIKENELVTSEALNDLDGRIGSGFSVSSITEVIKENELVTSEALNDLNERKLDVSAYTPTDLSNYYTKSETSGATQISNALGSKVNNATYRALNNVVTAHTANTTIHVTQADKDKWNNGTGGGGFIEVTNPTDSTKKGLVNKLSQYYDTNIGKGAVIEGDGSNNNNKISASGARSHAEGHGTTASGGYGSHAEGSRTIASGMCSHAEGVSTKANGDHSHAEGNNTQASGEYGSHAEGYYTQANGKYGSHAEGSGTTASGQASHAEGNKTSAIGNYSHAEGESTSATSVHSHAEGNSTIASGGYGSHAEGNRTIASGNYGSHAEGLGTQASGECGSHSEGYETKANGRDSHSEGCNTKANGAHSHAEGTSTQANGDSSHAEGVGTIANNQSEHASGQYNVSSSASTTFGDSGNTLFSVGNGTSSGRHNAFEIRQNGDIYITSGNTGIKLQDHLGGGGTSYIAGRGIDITNDTISFNLPISAGTGTNSIIEGYYTKASGYCSHAEGNSAQANGESSHAEGYSTKANGTHSHAEGQSTQASSQSSHAEGFYTTASGGFSHAEGYYTTASGQSSHAEGQNTKANGEYSHAEGFYTTASGNYSHVEGYQTVVSGDCSHAEGYWTIASGLRSHAEGQSTKASGACSHAEGSGTTASGQSSHAEGQNTKANYYYSHAEGCETTANGQSSHAEGQNTTANYYYSHAEGYYTTANGGSSHAEGNNTKANGEHSHAEGTYTVTNNKSEHASGQYNVSSSASTTFGNSGNTLFSVGNGTLTGRHNAFEIRQNGDIYITSGNTDIKLQDNIGVDLSNYYTKSETSGATELTTAFGAKADKTEDLDGVKLKKITQSAYDALVQAGTIDPNTLYIITDNNS